MRCSFPRRFSFLFKPRPPKRNYGDRDLYYDQKIEVGIQAPKEVVPELSDRDAMLETITAIHYASVVAPKWLYAAL